MKKNLKFLVIAVFIFALFSGCSLFSSGNDLEPETVLPKDSNFILMIDHSNEEQVEIFSDLMDKFPETGLMDAIMQTTIGFDSSYESEDFSFKDDIEPIFEADWKIVFGGSGDVEEFFEAGPYGNFYLAGKFEEADEVEDLFDILIAEERDMEKTEDGDFTIWKIVNGEGESDEFFVRYGDVFFVATGEEFFEAAKERILNGGGLDMNTEINAKLKKFGDGNLGYVLDEGIFAVLSADETGLRVSSEVLLSEKIKEQYGDVFGYKLSMVEKMPAAGVFLYLEQAELGSFVRSFLIGFYSALGVDFDGTREGAIQSISDFIGVAKKDLDVFSGAPFAFSVSSTGGFFPNLVWLVNLGNGQNASRNMDRALDVFMDGVIAEFNDQVGEDVLKREIKMQNGNAMRRVYFDGTKLPTEVGLQLNAILNTNVSALKLEFYYGMIDDGVYAFAFYPEFLGSYGKSVLAYDERFKSAQKMVNGVYGDVSLIYANSEFFADWLYKFLDVFGAVGFDFDEKEMSQMKRMINAFSTIRYLILSAKIENGKEIESGYLRIEEPEKLPETEVSE